METLRIIPDAKEYIKALDLLGIQNINGDIFHMQDEEVHVGEALIDAGEMLTTCIWPTVTVSQSEKVLLI